LMGHWTLKHGRYSGFWLVFAHFCAPRARASIATDSPGATFAQAKRQPCVAW
jgi:hypothetical protein